MATATITDIGAIWEGAIHRYEMVIGMKVESLAKANNVDEILSQIQGNVASFKAHRHDGSKLDRFRSLVSKSLDPVEQISKIVASAVLSVRQHIPPCIWLINAHMDVTKVFLSQHRYLHGSQLSHKGKTYLPEPHDTDQT